MSFRDTEHLKTPQCMTFGLS